tara:strand:+ start:361 stop:681 length:321 start_codon:yes stop_codon:yes gene_type:complete
MKYYLTKTDVRRGDPQKGEPAIVATEVVMTKPATYKATEGARQRWTAMGIENLHVIEHKAKRYNSLVREQNKRRKAEKKMTKADLAEIAAAFADNDEENKEEGSND